MPQISFTKNNSDVYDRFSRLLLKEQLNRGKLTAPKMLDLLLDGFESLEVIYEEIWRRFHDNEEEAFEAMSDDLRPKMKVIKKILSK